MTIPRFFLPAESIDLAAARVAITNPVLVNQIRKVLRAKPGEQIQVLDGLGSVYFCRLLELDGKRVEAEIVKREVPDINCPLAVTVLLPLLRGGRFEWALEKMTELGVAKIIPVIFNRSVVRTGGSAKVDHWRAVLREAAEQCERVMLPLITEPRELDDIDVADMTTKSGCSPWMVLCAERSDAPLLGGLVYSKMIDNSLPENIAVLVGPEGGITGDEMQSLKNCGWQKVSLGPRVLRSETAAISALAQIMSVQVE